MPADSSFSVETQEVDDATIIRPFGDVDLSSSPMLRATLHQAGDKSKPRLIVDLSAVGYMDSSGVATLVEALQTTRRNEAQLILCSMTDRVRSIFQIARLDAIFTIVDDLDAAAGDVV